MQKIQKKTLPLRLYLFLVFIYQGVSFNNPPLGKNPPANIWLRFCKNKTPRPKFGGDAEKISNFRAKRAKKNGLWAIYGGKTWTNPKISREAREKNRVLGPTQRGNVKKNHKFAREARGKNRFFWPYTRKNVEKNTKKRPPEAAANFDKNKPPHIQIGWDFEKWNPRT